VAELSNQSQQGVSGNRVLVERLQNSAEGKITPLSLCETVIVTDQGVGPLYLDVAPAPTRDTILLFCKAFHPSTSHMSFVGTMAVDKYQLGMELLPQMYAWLNVPTSQALSMYIETAPKQISQLNMIIPLRHTALRNGGILIAHVLYPHIRDMNLIAYTLQQQSRRRVNFRPKNRDQTLPTRSLDLPMDSRYVEISKFLAKELNLQGPEFLRLWGTDLDKRVMQPNPERRAENRSLSAIIGDVTNGGVIFYETLSVPDE
jgi:hypothetical protein